MTLIGCAGLLRELRTIVEVKSQEKNTKPIVVTRPTRGRKPDEPTMTAFMKMLKVVIPRKFAIWDSRLTPPVK